MQTVPTQPSQSQSPTAEHHPSKSPVLADTLKSRRRRLSKLIDFPVLLWSG
ncbi:MAG: hypothetical protein AAGL17_21545 [Cyanobacteria bacterium J06576_12]